MPTLTLEGPLLVKVTVQVTADDGGAGFGDCGPKVVAEVRRWLGLTTATGGAAQGQARRRFVSLPPFNPFPTKAEWTTPRFG